MSESRGSLEVKEEGTIDPDLLDLAKSNPDLAPDLLELAHIDPELASLAKNFFLGLDNYALKNHKNKDITETPAESMARTEEILGTEGTKILHGVKKANKKGHYANSQNKRKKFIIHLLKVLADPEKNFTVEGEPDPRITNPDDYATTMEALLGKEGLQLFKDAIKEEGESVNYRDAVFLSATENFHGPKWDERMILWVGGPSASGKTFSSKLVIKDLQDNGILSDPLKNNPETDNFVVAIDGGVERELSQMRQLVLQLALKKGYPGISDLNDFTHLRIKKIIQEAALTNPNLNLVIPETFSKYPLEIYDPATYDHPDYKCKQIFSEVIAAPPTLKEDNPELYEKKKERFKDVVKRGGEARAYSSNFTPTYLKEMEITLNNRNIKCESKRYEAENFDAGKRGSKRARKKYIERSKHKIYAPIISDRLVVRIKDDNPTEWIECDPQYNKGKTYLVSERDLKKWQLFVNNNFTSSEPNFPHELQGVKSFATWFETLEKAKKLSSPIIQIEKRGHLLSEPVFPQAFPHPMVAYATMSKTGLTQLADGISKANIEYLSRVGNNAVILPPLEEKANELIASQKAVKQGKILQKDAVDPSELKEKLREHLDQPLFMENGKLAEWIKPILPKKMLPLFEKFFQEYFKTLGSLILTSDGQIQPWFINAVGIDNFQKISSLNKKGYNEVLFQTAVAIQVIMTEALIIKISDKTYSPDEQEALTTFLTFFQTILNHQQNIDHQFAIQVSKLESFKKQRLPDQGTELEIAHLADQGIEAMKKLLANPFDPIVSDMRLFFKATFTAINNKVNHLKQTQEIKEEAIQSDPLPQHSATGSPRFFSPPETAAKLKSNETHSPENITPQKHNITFIKKSQKKLKATLEEQATKDGMQLASNLTKLDEDLDTAKIFAKIASNFVDPRTGGKKLNLFPSLNDAFLFFKKAINELRDDPGYINKDTLMDYLEENLAFDLEHDLSFMLADNLIRIYKNMTEQLDPYPIQDTTIQSSDPYERKNHLPSDAFIRLAKHHVDTYCDFLGEDKPAMVIGTRCWDPHYVEAVMLYCGMKNLPQPEYNTEEGWLIEEITPEKQMAFNQLYEEKFKVLDDIPKEGYTFDLEGKKEPPPTRFSRHF